MSKKKRRKFTVEQKVRLLEEARAPDTTVSEVVRRHQVDQTRERRETINRKRIQEAA